MPRLRFLNGPKRDRTIELQGGEVLGREAGTAVQLTGEGIAAQHCRVVRVDPYFFLIDLGSETGTFVNSERVEKSLLRDKDEVRVGSLTLRYEDGRAHVRPQTLSEHGLSQSEVRVEVSSELSAAGSEGARRRPLASQGSTPCEPPTELQEPAPGPRPPRPGSSSRLLDRLGVDLSAAARAGELEPLVGRQAELRRLSEVLLQKRKRNAVLVGEAGVGKTCLVEGLAQRLLQPDAPAELRAARIVQLPLGELVAGTKYRGEFEERVQQLLRELSAEPELILFLDELHLALGMGRTEHNPVDVANLLKPALARADLRVIGATTPEEYERHVASDRAFARRFETLWLEEPTRAEAHEILLRLRPSYEEHHRVELELSALEAAIELSQRYLPERRLPDKALDLLDQTCARGRLASKGRVGREDVADLVAERARVPRHSLLRSESERLEALREFLAGRIVGQDPALDQVAATLRAARAGLRGERRPRASFLCAGPSGTGKTALAKALAAFLFDDEERLVRVDLSEFSERHSLARLIGSPAGYVGHGEEGQLTGALRRQPFSVVLFDELEKAHPDVLNVLLQLLDEGRLSDARGRPASFREAIVILTSNLGSTRGEALGFGGAGASPAERALAEELRPELLNRLDAVLEFGPLDEEALERVCLLEVGRLRGRLLAKGLAGLTVSGEARRELARRGRDVRYGARALLREVERALAEPLAAALTQSALRPGDAARLELSRGELVLRFDEGVGLDAALGAQGADPEAACP